MRTSNRWVIAVSGVFFQIALGAVYAWSVFPHDYEAEFPLRWMQKDMHLATVSAYEAGVAMPLTNVAKEMYRLAMGDGRAMEDFSAIYEFLGRDRHSLRVAKSRPSVPLARDSKVPAPSAKLA